MAFPPPKLRWAVFIGLACLAFAIRLPQLGERPMHTDEAVNAYLIGQLLEDQSYQYDPKDRHGPALYALAWPVARIAGAKNLAELNEADLRLVPVIVGAAIVLALALMASRIGFLPAFFAALLFAISPLPVYYSRYFIHETLFVAATLGLIIAGWRLLVPSDGDGWGEARGENAIRAGNRRHFLIRGALIGFWAALMLACKETAVLHFTALGAAAGWWLFISRRTGKGEQPEVTVSHVPWMATGGTMLAVFVFVLVALYSWGGKHWRGISDLAHALPHLSSRAAGEGHEKPFWYYFTLLGGGWSGIAVLALGVLGAAAIVSGAPISQSARKSNSSKSAGSEIGVPILFQSLLVYTIVIIALYSVIPYKTPWLALNLWLPLSLFAGCGVAFLWRKAQATAARGLIAVGMIALMGLLGRDSWQRVFTRSFDENNPYAYAHTGEDLLRLPERIAELTPKQSTHILRIAVIAADPWPLPWYLRKFRQVGFWQPDQDPGSADVYITSPEVAERMTRQLANRRPEFFGVRPEVLVILWPPPKSELRHE